MIEYWKFFHRYEKKTEKLSDQELGRLVRALNHYSMTGERQELAGRESIAFDFIADDIEQNQQAYDNKCKTNAANASERKRTLPIASDGSEIDKQKQKQKQKHNDVSNETSTARARDVFEEFAFDDPETLAALKGFEEMRKKIKKPLTERAKERILDKLRKVNDPALWVQMLDESTAHCWQDVYPPKPGSAAASYDVQAAETEAKQGAPAYQRRK